MAILFSQATNFAAGILTLGNPASIFMAAALPRPVGVSSK